MITHDELGTCEASLVPPEQFVLSIPVSPIDMSNIGNGLLRVYM